LTGCAVTPPGATTICHPAIPEQENVTRKLVWAVTGVIIAALAATGCNTSVGATPHVGNTHPQPSLSGQPASSRPNIIFVLTDDLSWNLVSNMPHVKQLEQAGSTMSHYYVVDSLCCPSRSAIFTGQYPHDDGVFTNTGSDGGYNAYNLHGDQQKSFALALQKSGYKTALMGKYLNGYKPKDVLPPGWNQWDVAGNGYPEFNYDLNENGTLHHYGKKPRDYLTDVVSGKATSFIKSTASAGSPFMLEVATFAPHWPFTPAPRYAHAAARIPYPQTNAYNRLPVNPPSWLKGRPPLTRGQRTRIDGIFRKRVEADLSVDDMIGHLEAELRATGQAKNTYFVFSSDNGYHMGEYRLMPGKRTAYDTDIHVPLVVSGPGIPAGRTISQLTSSIDLAATFESLAGLTVPATVDGHSLVDLWHGHDPPGWRQAILIEHHGPDNSPSDPDRGTVANANPPSYEAIRTASALYVLYANGEQEYYNTLADPNELDNLGARAVPPALQRTMRALENCHTGGGCWAAAHIH
jgi:N-acetylglucosamine-6-sulfatase